MICRVLIVTAPSAIPDATPIVDRQSPSGGNWWGCAQNSKRLGRAKSSPSLSSFRNLSRVCASAEASQAAPDLIACCVKVESIVSVDFKSLPILLRKSFLRLHCHSQPRAQVAKNLTRLGICDVPGLNPFLQVSYIPRKAAQVGLKSFNIFV